MASLPVALADEYFGERLARARARTKQGTREIADRISRFWPVSHSTLARLEWEKDPPADRRRRAIAALYAYALGYDPAAFGLSRADVPEALDVDRVAELLVPSYSDVDSDTGGPSDKDKSWNRWSPASAAKAPAA